MRRYLLDSSPLAAYLNQRQPAINLIRPWIADHEAATGRFPLSLMGDGVRG